MLGGRDRLVFEKSRAVCIYVWPHDFLTHTGNQPTFHSMKQLDSTLSQAKHDHQ
jgi:hypothetical protein